MTLYFLLNHEFFRIISNKNEMALTNHQEEKLKEGIEILKHSRRLLIKGSAGVGKTFMVDTLIGILSSYFNSKQLVYCSAPTHKAVSVLSQKVKRYNNLQFITTHSALKLKRQIDKFGNVKFVPNFSQKYPPLKDVKLLIIDECSMINSEMLDYIEQYAKENSTIVIFIGDDKQLNPVGESDSPVFMADYPTIELTEIVRQKGGNPIIDLSRNLPSISLREENRTDIGGYIYTYDEQRVIETLAAVNGTDDLKYLAYTNAEVDKINRKVRQRIYGNPAKIEEGETLIFNAPYGDLYFTNQEILVEKVEVREREFQYKVMKHTGLKEDEYEKVLLKYYSINPFYDSLKKGTVDNIIVIHEDSEKELKRVEKEMKDKAKTADIAWIDYYGFIEMFADLKYNHAITVHKSQGSTYKQAILNIRDIKINRDLQERDRLLYTGVTRASELLILYNV